MNNQHAIKGIFLIHNLRNGINKRGFASRATYIYLKKVFAKQIKRQQNEQDKRNTFECCIGID